MVGWLPDQFPVAGVWPGSLGRFGKSRSVIDGGQELFEVAVPDGVARAGYAAHSQSQGGEVGQVFAADTGTRVGVHQHRRRRRIPADPRRREIVCANRLPKRGGGLHVPLRGGLGFDQHVLLRPPRPGGPQVVDGGGGPIGGEFGDEFGSVDWIHGASQPDVDVYGSLGLQSIDGGGASFPAALGTLTVTHPLAVLTTSESGIRVDVRSRALKRVLGRAVLREPSTAWWTAEWSDLASVDVGRRSVILHHKQRQGCRFVTMTRRRILPLVEELERRGILVIRVRTTIGWFLKPI